jgi:hypothetical protein
LTATALIEQYGAKTRGIKKTPMLGRAATARAAMQKNNGDAVWRTALFNGQQMAVADRQTVFAEWHARREQAAGHQYTLLAKTRLAQD